MKLLYVHGFASGGQTETAQKLRKLLPGHTLLSPDFDMDPFVAMEQLKKIVAEEKPEVLIGMNTGGTLVQKMYGHYRVLFNPIFATSKEIKNAPQQLDYDCPRNDGEQTFEIKESIKQHFQQFFTTQFDQIPEGEEKYIYGIFADSNTNKNYFKQHYKYNFGYKGDWKTDDVILADIFAPLLNEILDTMAGRKKPILYIDMDNTLVDFKSAVEALPMEDKIKYKDHYDDVPHLFQQMPPIKGAVEAVKKLSRYFDIYILSTAPWDNETSWGDKCMWVKGYLGYYAYKRLILSHHKNLNKGDYLIDDCGRNGTREFEGEWIQIGKPPYENWEKILAYFTQKGLMK